MCGGAVIICRPAPADRMQVFLPRQKHEVWLLLLLAVYAILDAFYKMSFAPNGGRPSPSAASFVSGNNCFKINDPNRRHFVH